MRPRQSGWRANCDFNVPISTVAFGSWIAATGAVLCGALPPKPLLLVKARLVSGQKVAYGDAHLKFESPEPSIWLLIVMFPIGGMTGVELFPAMVTPEVSGVSGTF